MTRTFQCKKYASKWLLAIGLILVILGFIALNLVNKNNYDKSLAYGSMVSISISICSLGLGVFALGLSFSSSIKNDINSNENFLRIVDKFQDMRIDLFQRNARGDYSLITRGCWKFVTYIKRAGNLHEMANINRDNQSQLFNEIKVLMFYTALPWRPMPVTSGNKIIMINIMEKKDIQNVLNVCEYSRKFSLNKVQKTTLEEYIKFVEYILENYYR